VENLASWEEQYKERISGENSVRDAVSRILSGKTGTKSVVVGSRMYQVGDKITVPSWQWVEVLNKESVKQEFSNGAAPLRFKDTCGIEPGGFIEVLGFHVEQGTTEALVKYTAPGKPVGTPCPTGVIFLRPLF
jgi:hypothetical protein